MAKEIGKLKQQVVDQEGSHLLQMNEMEEVMAANRADGQIRSGLRKGPVWDDDDFEELQEENAKLKAALEVLQQQVIDYEGAFLKEVNELEEVMAANRADGQIKSGNRKGPVFDEDDFEDLQKDHADLQKELEAARLKISDLEKDLNFQKDESQKLLIIIAKLTDENEAVSKTLADVTKEKDDLVQKTNQLEQTNSNLQEEIRILTELLSEKEKDLEASQEECEQLNDENQKLTDENNSKTEKIEELGEEMAEMQETLQGQINDQHDEIVSLREQLEKANEINENLKNQISDLE